jgi:hypothetical protein
MTYGYCMRQVKPESPRPRILGGMNARTDRTTATTVDAAVFLKRISGVGAAARLLCRNEVPLALALRVLARPRAWRR